MKNQNRQNNIYVENYSRRRDVGAHPRWLDTERSMRHFHDVFLKEEQYEVITFRKWALINLSTLHDNCSLLPLGQVDFSGDYGTKIQSSSSQKLEWKRSLSTNYDQNIVVLLLLH